MVSSGWTITYSQVQLFYTVQGRKGDFCDMFMNIVCKLCNIGSQWSYIIAYTKKKLWRSVAQTLCWVYGFSDNALKIAKTIRNWSDRILILISITTEQNSYWCFSLIFVLLTKFSHINLNFKVRLSQKKKLKPRFQYLSAIIWPKWHFTHAIWWLWYWHIWYWLELATLALFCRFLSFGCWLSVPKIRLVW